VVPERWRYSGKVVRWDFAEKKFKAGDSRVRF
jgi:hypothetical protein